MSRRAQENLIVLLVIGILIATITISLDYSPRARLVPIPIAAIGLVMAIGQLILQNFRSENDLRINVMELVARRSAKSVIGEKTTSRSVRELAKQKGVAPTFFRELKSVVAVALLVVMFLYLGPLLSIFLFSAAYMISIQRQSFFRGVLFSAAFSAVVFLIFTGWLGVNLLPPQTKFWLF